MKKKSFPISLPSLSPPPPPAPEKKKKHSTYLRVCRVPVRARVLGFDQPARVLDHLAAERSHRRRDLEAGHHSDRGASEAVDRIRGDLERLFFGFFS